MSRTASLPNVWPAGADAKQYELPLAHPCAREHHARQLRLSVRSRHGAPVYLPMLALVFEISTVATALRLQIPDLKPARVGTCLPCLPPLLPIMETRKHFW